MGVWKIIYLISPISWSNEVPEAADYYIYIIETDDMVIMNIQDSLRIVSCGRYRRFCNVASLYNGGGHMMTSFNIILFDGFETLDAFGAAEIIGRLPNEYRLSCYSLNGGIIKSTQQIAVDTLPLTEIDTSGILLIPGGMGTRTLVNDENLIEKLKILAEKAPYVLTVCTGSALLAKTNLLDGLKATSNKRAFEWVCSNSTAVNWVKKARWVEDGKYYSSSGISAGIDMTLGFVSHIHGKQTAQNIAYGIEYIWSSDMDNDPFAVE